MHSCLTRAPGRLFMLYYMYCVNGINLTFDFEIVTDVYILNINTVF